MATRAVEMAVRDPKTGKITMGIEEVEIVRVTIRNRDRRSGGHVFNDVISGEVKFKPGEVKTLEIAEPLAARIRSRRDPTWELTTAAPTSSALAEDDEEEAPEPTSSEASSMAAAAEEQVQRVQRRRPG